MRVRTERRVGATTWLEVEPSGLRLWTTRDTPLAPRPTAPPAAAAAAAAAGAAARARKEGGGRKSCSSMYCSSASVSIRSGDSRRGNCPRPDGRARPGLRGLVWCMTRGKRAGRPDEGVVW